MGTLVNAIKAIFANSGSSTPEKTITNRVPILDSANSAIGSCSIGSLITAMKGGSVTTFTSGAISNFLTVAGVSFFMVAYSNQSNISDLPETGHGFGISMSNGTVGFMIYGNLVGSLYCRFKSGSGVSDWKKIA